MESSHRSRKCIDAKYVLHFLNAFRMMSVGHQGALSPRSLRHQRRASGIYNRASSLRTTVSFLPNRVCLPSSALIKQEIIA